MAILSSLFPKLLKMNQVQVNGVRLAHKKIQLQSNQVGRQIEYFSADKYCKSNILNVSKRPLVVMLNWMMAKPKHVFNYSSIYLNKGYDVVTVTLTPWQFFWPPVAEELLVYINEKTGNQPLIVHGFSIGAYLWGEVLVKMNENLPQYENLIKRVKGQIWDSAPDIAELHKGLPKALAPHNAILQTAMEKYVSYHLKTFYNVATQHYIRSSQFLHSTCIRAPTLLFICKNDPIASEASNLKVKESWDLLGMKTYWKCWDKSKHVSHLALHREEYLATLEHFLHDLDLEEQDVPIKAKL